jgi:hypothetical protein
MPQTNVSVLGHEVDAFWPAQRLVVEADGYGFHRHRSAFERDRARDAARMVEGYRVVRFTHRRLTTGTSVKGQLGQGTVEWVALLLLVSLLLGGVIAAGVRVPGAALAQAVASRILCAASFADSCGDEPALIAAYGSETGRIVGDNMPSLLLERGSRALPVDFRRCRSSACADGSARGVVNTTDEGLPVTAFVHVIDCRPDAREAPEGAGADCSGPRAGNLYIQYWLFYEDSTSLRALPGRLGFHEDDWEGYQVRIGPAGRFARATAHHGYSYGPIGGLAGYRVQRGPDGALRIRRVARVVNGWGPETGTIYVSGGSHAGRARSGRVISRSTKDHRLVLIPIEALADRDSASFAVSPPWRKRAYFDPEYSGTD